MRDDMFNELVESVKEGGAILRGEASAARETAIEEPEVGEIRAEYGLSQAKFAAMLGISVRTLQNWEQGPRGENTNWCFYSFFIVMTKIVHLQGNSKLDLSR